MLDYVLVPSLLYLIAAVAMHASVATLPVWAWLYNSHTFTWALVFGAVSVAVLSFLGFDGISMLAEENKGGAGQIGRAMAAALGVAGLLFIVQTWVAALLVPGADELRSQPQVEQIINTVEALVGETAVAVYR